jgi:SAM-dependent methyltransferase
MKILDLGCGKNKYKSESDEVIGMDKFQVDEADVIHDLEVFPYPFPDNHFDMIHSNHSIEHVTNFFGLMEECWRILKPKGRFKIQCPYGLSCLGLPSHKIFLTIRSFQVFEPNHAESYNTKARFKIIKKHLTFVKSTKLKWLNLIVNPILNLNYRATESFIRHYLPISELSIELEVIK